MTPASQTGMMPARDNMNDAATADLPPLIPTPPTGRDMYRAEQLESVRSRRTVRWVHCAKTVDPVTGNWLVGAPYRDPDKAVRPPKAERKRLRRRKNQDHDCAKDGINVKVSSWATVRVPDNAVIPMNEAANVDVLS